MGQCPSLLADTLSYTDPLILGGPGRAMFVGRCDNGHANPVLVPDGPPHKGNARGDVHTQPWSTPTALLGSPNQRAPGLGGGLSPPG